MIIGTRWESLIQEQLNVFLWDILLLWSPAERKFFFSMDVTFHEKEPFITEKENLLLVLIARGRCQVKGPLLKAR
jgi:hypothetical protein